MPTSALHVARTGLEAQDTRMRVIANNLANIGTTGFKRDRADFATLGAYAIGLNLGTGVQVQGTSRIDTQGTLSTTGNSLDVAINVPQGSQSISIAPDGTVSATLQGDNAPQQLGQLTIASFVNPAGLQALGDNFLAETAASGPADIGPGGENGRGGVRQGMLLTGCGLEGGRPQAGFTPPPSMALPAPDTRSSNGAIFQVNSGYAGLHQGNRARAVGDLVTIILLNPSANGTFTGSGDAQQQSRLNGAIAVTIAAVHPGGTATVVGEKQMSLSQGDEWVQFAGTIRLADISSDNRMSSNQVANARMR